MQLVLRRPFHPSDVCEPAASWPVTIFVMMVSGFITEKLCSECLAKISGGSQISLNTLQLLVK